jgi:hypothetical protein
MYVLQSYSGWYKDCTFEEKKTWLQQQKATVAEEILYSSCQVKARGI